MKKPEKSEIEECIAAYGKDLYSFCCYLTSNKTEAEDLYQDTLLKVIEIGIESSNNPKSFILSVAVRLWKNKRRKLNNKERLIYAGDITEVGEDKFKEVHRGTPEEIAIQNEADIQIRRAVENLPDRFRVVTLLYYMEDKDVREISKIIHVPEGTVKSRLYKARKLLYTKLEGVI